MTHTREERSRKRAGSMQLLEVNWVALRGKVVSSFKMRLKIEGERKVTGNALVSHRWCRELRRQGWMKSDASLSSFTSKCQLVWTGICSVNLTGQPHWFCKALHLARVSPKSIRNMADEQMHKRRLKCSQVTKKCGAGRNKDELQKRQRKEGENKELGHEDEMESGIQRGHEQKEKKMNWGWNELKREGIKMRWKYRLKTGG